MKNSILISIFAIFAIASLPSCKTMRLVPYTNAVGKDFNREPSDWQFYVSKDTWLRQDSVKTVREQKDGVGHKTKFVKINEVFIESITPGLAVSDTNDETKKILVSFDQDDSHYLSFKCNPAHPDSSKFSLSVSKSYAEGLVQVTYNKAKYFTYDHPFLLVDIKSTKKVDYNFRKAKGRKYGKKK